MKIGKILAVALLGLTAVSAVTVLTSVPDDEDAELKEYQSKFEIYDKKKMYDMAEDCYKWIAEYQKDDYNVLKGYISYCEEHGFWSECYSACTYAQTVQPYDFDTVELILRYYTDKKDNAIYEFLHKMMDRFNEEEYPQQYKELSEKYDSIKGTLQRVSGKYDEVSRWNDSYAIAQTGNNTFCVIDSNGENLNELKSRIYSYSPKEKLVAIEDDDQMVYANLSGTRKRVPFDMDNLQLLNYKYLGPFVSGGANICISENEWQYACFTNDNIKLITETFEEATPFWNSIGTVKKDGKWGFVGYGFKEDDSTWESGQIYDDVFRDEFGCAIFNGVCYVKKDGADKWSAVRIDIPDEDDAVPTVTEIASDAFLEVKPFTDYGTVKTTDGKWCLIDKKGNTVLTTDYSDLGEAGCGLVGYCFGDKWGFIDISGKTIIEPSYKEVTSFNQNGTAFVKSGDQWAPIRLKEYACKEN